MYEKESILKAFGAENEQLKQTLGIEREKCHGLQVRALVDDTSLSIQ